MAKHTPRLNEDREQISRFLELFAQTLYECVYPSIVRVFVFPNEKIPDKVFTKFVFPLSLDRSIDLKLY